MVSFASLDIVIIYHSFQITQLIQPPAPGQGLFKITTANLCLLIVLLSGRSSGSVTVTSNKIQGFGLN